MPEKSTNPLPPALLTLLDTPTPPALGPEARSGTLSVAGLRSRLEAVLRGVSLAPEQQALIRSAVLLWHDHLDESHTISQGIHSAEGSLLHAIMHRREPDASNAKYWWNRVGGHPCFDAVAERAVKLLESRGQGTLAAELAPGGEWDPFAFVDACERARHRGSEAERAALQEVQRVELEAFLEWLLTAH
jgi:hypothetical protein